MKYRSENVQLLKGDCLELMKDLPNESIDMILCDPPYLMNYQSGRRKDKFKKIDNDVDAYELIKETLKESYRVMKDNTSIYMFCSWHHVDFFKQAIEKEFKLKNIIVWNKNNHGAGDLKGAYAPKHEFVLYAHKGRSTFNEKRIPDVIDCAKVIGKNMLHPTEKPIDLLELFIERNSKEKEVVLDMFMGSGTTGVACKNLDREFIGMELDEGYFNIAKERIENA